MSPPIMTGFFRLRETLQFLYSDNKKTVKYGSKT